MAFLVATTSLPAVYRPNGYARTPTAGTPHARANMIQSVSVLSVLSPEPTELFYCGYHALDSAALSTSYNELGQWNADLQDNKQTLQYTMLQCVLHARLYKVVCPEDLGCDSLLTRGVLVVKMIYNIKIEISKEKDTNKKSQHYSIGGQLNSNRQWFYLLVLISKINGGGLEEHTGGQMVK